MSSFQVVDSSPGSSVSVMETSNFAHVIFQNVGKSFLPQAPLECRYTLTPYITPHPKDWVGIFKVHHIHSQQLLLLRTYFKYVKQHNQLRTRLLLMWITYVTKIYLEIWAISSPLHKCLWHGLCVRVLLIGHRLALGTLTHTSVLTLMAQLFTTCLKPHHNL